MKYVVGRPCFDTSANVSVASGRSRRRRSIEMPTAPAWAMRVARFSAAGASWARRSSQSRKEGRGMKYVVGRLCFDTSSKCLWLNTRSLRASSGKRQPPPPRLGR